MGRPPAVAGSRDPLAALLRDYRVAFLRYLPRRDEAALSAAYELGRSALAGQVSVLDIVRVHHEVLREIVAATVTGSVDDVIDAGADFLSETLAAIEMARRRLHEPG